MDKHPYFFRYLYLDTEKRYKDYIKFFEHKVKLKLGMTLEELLEKKDLDEIEKEMVKNYHLYLPVIDSDCVMNNLCKYVEKINVSLKTNISRKKAKTLYKTLMRDLNIKDDIVYKKIIKVYKNIKAGREIEWGIGAANTSTDANDYYLDNRREYLQSKFFAVTSDVYKIVDSLVYNMYVEEPVVAKYLLWYLFGNIVFKNILRNQNEVFKFPVEDVNGEIEYLNKKYTMKEVKLDED